MNDIFERIAILVEMAGVGVILLGIAVASLRFVYFLWRRRPNAYIGFRQDLGKAILLGLEFLVAGDIIQTVTVEPSVENVVVLGVIVLLRTFLSVSLEMEIEGGWPWRRGHRREGHG